MLIIFSWPEILLLPEEMRPRTETTLFPEWAWRKGEGTVLKAPSLVSHHLSTSHPEREGTPKTEALKRLILCLVLSVCLEWDCPLSSPRKLWAGLPLSHLFWKWREREETTGRKSKHYGKNVSNKVTWSLKKKNPSHLFSRHCASVVRFFLFHSLHERLLGVWYILWDWGCLSTN